MYKITLSDKIVIAICIALNLWVNSVYAQICKPVDKDLPMADFIIAPGEIFATPIEIVMENTNEYLSHTEIPNTVGNYLDIAYDQINSTISVMTKTSFLNFEKEQTSTSLVATVQLNCDGAGPSAFHITLDFLVVNHFAPKFSEDRYEIEIPLPLPIGINIFVLISERISATDYDLQNNQITFTSDITTQPFIVTKSVTTGTLGKEFFADIITTEKIFNIQNSIEFKITATDSGTTEQKSTTVDVKLIAQYEESEIIQFPIFVKSLYMGTLDFTNTPPLDIETISLLSETFVRSITFATDQSDGDNFQLIRDGTNNAIETSLQDAVTENDFSGRTRLSFVVIATRIDGVSGRTAVLIDIISRKSLVFENKLYIGIIESDKTIDHDMIKLSDDTYQSDVEFLVKDDPFGWFDAIYNPTVNQMTIQLKPTISNADLYGETLVSLTVSAISASNTFLEGESHVVLGIKSLDVTPTTPTTSTQEPINPTNVCDECDDISFIVGLIVLTVLLLLACIAIFALWWRWIRPYRYLQRDSSKDQLGNDFNDTGYTEPIVIPAVNNNRDSDIFGKSSFEIKNENLPIEAKPELSNTSSELLNQSLQSILEMDEKKVNLVDGKEGMPGDSESDESTKSPPKTRKKSIKFNEMVERIDIIDDTNDKD